MAKGYFLSPDECWRPRCTKSGTISSAQPTATRVVGMIAEMQLVASTNEDDVALAMSHGIEATCWV